MFFSLDQPVTKNPILNTNPFLKREEAWLPFLFSKWDKELHLVFSRWFLFLSGSTEESKLYDLSRYQKNVFKQNY